MKRKRALLFSSSVLMLLTAAAAETPTPLIQNTFDQGAGAWTSIGTNARVTTAPGDGTDSALRLDYDVTRGNLAALMLPTPEGALAKAKSFRFRVKADYTTPIVVGLQEKDGGRYIAFFTAPKDRWQTVELAPSDFVLADDKNDPKDPNDRLDLDLVEGIAVADLGQFFARIDNPEFARLLNVKTGAHTLYLDDFTVSAESLPAASTASNDLLLDTFARPQIAWFAVGDVRLGYSEGKPLAGRSLQAEYHQSPGKIIGFARRIPRGQLAGRDRLIVTAAATKTTRLVVQLEEQSGGKYNTTFELPAGSTAREIPLPFAEFDAADDSKDDNNKLDLEKVRQILLIDATGLFGTPGQDNTLWIGKLRALPAN